MALPGLTFTIRDGALGIVPPGSSNIHLKIGPAPFGLINTTIYNKSTIISSS
jgi:hypothetical protein